MKRLVAWAVGVAAMAAVLLLGARPAAASAVCPPPPTELVGLISPDATYQGPLTEAYRPIFGVYAEAAAACWPLEEITVVGFVASPEGLGGARPFTIEPGWIVSLAHFLSTTDQADPLAGPVGPFFAVAVPPALEARFSSFEGRWVRVSGHFNDRAAKTCVTEPSGANLPGVPTPEQAIEICRTSFVLSSVEPLAGPPTDAEAPGAAATTPAGFGGASLAAAVAAGVGLGLALRRYGSPRRPGAGTGTAGPPPALFR